MAVLMQRLAACSAALARVSELPCERPAGPPALTPLPCACCPGADIAMSADVRFYLRRWEGAYAMEWEKGGDAAVVRFERQEDLQGGHLPLAWPALACPVLPACQLGSPGSWLHAVWDLGWFTRRDDGPCRRFKQRPLPRRSLSAPAAALDVLGGGIRGLFRVDRAWRPKTAVATAPAAGSSSSGASRGWGGEASGSSAGGPDPASWTAVAVAPAGAAPPQQQQQQQSTGPSAGTAGAEQQRWAVMTGRRAFRAKGENVHQSGSRNLLAELVQEGHDALPSDDSSESD